MARRNRRDTPDSWHHVINRGIARRPLFEDRQDIRYFLSRLAREVRRGRIEIHAYCILTTHYHLLIRSPKGNLSEAMRRAQNEYSRTFNRRHRRDGTLIRGRFLSKPVDSLEYQANLLAYIDENPVQAGLASLPWNYPWCSAAHYVHRRGPIWLERSWVEEHTRSTAERKTFSPADYAGLARPRLADGQRWLIEERLADPRSGLDDLIGAAPPAVREWMTRKARLADGSEIGVAVCDIASVRAAVEAGRAGGPWQIAPSRRGTDAWSLAEIGLLRLLAGLSLQRVSSETGMSLSSVRRRQAIHAELVGSNEEYGVRVGALGARALELCHRP